MNDIRPNVQRFTLVCARCGRILVMQLCPPGDEHYEHTATQQQAFEELACTYGWSVNGTGKRSIARCPHGCAR